MTNTYDTRLVFEETICLSLVSLVSKKHVSISWLFCVKSFAKKYDKNCTLMWFMSILSAASGFQQLEGISKEQCKLDLNCQYYSITVMLKNIRDYAKVHKHIDCKEHDEVHNDKEPSKLKTKIFNLLTNTYAT